MTGFVGLHVHTEYSLLDGASQIPDLVSRAVELGMPAIAFDRSWSHVWGDRADQNLQI